MKIEEIAKKIKQKGGNLYLVGGAVRDELIGRENHDKDYVITGITEDVFNLLFPNAKKRGKTFPVYEMEGAEFAFARKEKKTGTRHQDFEVDSNPEITIEEDLKRRDFTINSMAKEVNTNRIIDPFGGREDIKKKMLCMTSKAFKEDALRAYRGARFAATLGFKVETKTREEMKKMKEEVAKLPKERVAEEFKKALASDRPSRFFEELRKTNLLEVHFKEVYDLIGSEQPKEYHPEGDSYEHTLIVVDLAAEKTKNLNWRFSALVHDLGKGTTPKEMYPHHYGHDERGVELVDKLGKRIGVPGKWITCGKISCREHMRGGIFAQMSLSKQVAFIERVAKSPLRLEGLQLVVDCDKKGRNNKENRFWEIGEECLKKVNGKNIKIKDAKRKKGSEYGKLLHEKRVEWLKESRENICN